MSALFGCFSLGLILCLKELIKIAATADTEAQVSRKVAFTCAKIISSQDVYSYLFLFFSFLAALQNLFFCLVSRLLNSDTDSAEGPAIHSAAAFIGPTLI